VTLLSAAAVLALAAQCQHTYAPKTILAYAQGESLVPGTGGLLNADAIGRENPDHSRDYGLMQINSGNFGWLGLTVETAMDPCRSIAAAEKVLQTASRYNSGSPVKSINYALSVVAREHALSAADAATTTDRLPQTNQPAPPEEVVLDDRPTWNNDEPQHEGK
jgi:hypothetical protein